MRQRQGGWAGAAALSLTSLLLALGTASSCRARPSAPAPAVVEQGRFPHAMHSQRACGDCHPVEAVLAGQLARPGQRDHAACDASGCHRAAFLTEPGPLCRVCHSAIDISQPSSSPLKPYPPAAGQRALASVFSHAKHLDFDAMEAQVGFHVSCSDCHTANPADGGRMRLPGHDVCSRCHAPEAAPFGVVTMRACQSCHQPRAKPPTRTRKFIVGDLQFAHDNHQLDRRGARIRCDACHRDSVGADTVGKHPAPTTGACVACHDDSKRTPTVSRMQACGTCHATPRERLNALPPRSHLPARERPEDHTLGFRRDHAVEAEDEAERCAACHTFMSGAAHQVCDECHQSMRPTDHNLAWREFDHGPAAAIDSDRCATCHQASFCWACHQIPPRSHFPMSLWRGREHALPASLGLSACLTCHVPERSCQESGCHIGGSVTRAGR